MAGAYLLICLTRLYWLACLWPTMTCPGASRVTCPWDRTQGGVDDRIVQVTNRFCYIPWFQVVLWPGGCFAVCVTAPERYTATWFSQPSPPVPGGAQGAVVQEEAHTRDRSRCAVRNVADFRSSRTSIPGCRVEVRRRERHRAKCQPYSSWSARAGSRSRRNRGPSASLGPLSVEACARVSTPSHRRSRTRRFGRSHVCASPLEQKSPLTFPVRATTSRNTPLSLYVEDG